MDPRDDQKAGSSEAPLLGSPISLDFPRLARVCAAWSLGGAAAAALPLFGFFVWRDPSWNFQRPYEIVLCCFAATAGGLGIALAIKQHTPFPHISPTVGGGVLLAVIYPLAAMAPMIPGSGQAFFSGSSFVTRAVLAPIGVAVATGLAVIAPFFSTGRPNPRAAFRRAAWFWTSLSVYFLPAFGLGLVFVPLALANLRAATFIGAVRPCTRIR